MTGCPSSDALAQLVDDALPAEDRRTIEDHADECDDCRGTIAMLVRAAAAERRASEPTLGTSPPEAFETTVGPDVEAAAGPRSPLAPGTKVGRYIIRDVLGTGGMGVVYTAHDPELHREVALKLLRPEMSRADTEAAQRIAREARAMAQVAHPNVVAVFDVGTFDGQTFVTMERVAGASLREWLAASERSPAEIVDALIAAGHGLEAAHDRGIVHRDFKPDNVLVGSDGRVRVTDFGLAYDRGREDDPFEGTDRTTRPIAGTPAYMAPEQHAGANLDARTDQFSFAVTLYEALYRRRPYSGASRDELVSAVIDGRIDPPPPGSRIPASLRAIVIRALAVKPGDRYPTLADLLRALGRDRARRPRQIATAAVAALAIVAIGLGSDAVLRDRTHAVTRTSFAAARTQLGKLLALRTEAFIGQADAVFRLPVMQEVVASRDLVDFGLGDAGEDRARIEHLHDNLSSADWVALMHTHRDDVLAISDQKGRLLYDSAGPRWGTDLAAIPTIAAAYSSGADTYLGVIDSAAPSVRATGALGALARPALYVMFARAQRIGAQPRAMFVQLVEAGHLLEQVGVGPDTYLSVATAEHSVEGTVPERVIARAQSSAMVELELGDGTWLAERAQLRAPGQSSAIAEIVLARRTDLGLSGLFPRARLLLGVLAGILAAVAVASLLVARRRDLTRSR